MQVRSPFCSINFNNVALSAPTASLATGVANAGSIPINNVTGLDHANYKAPISSQFSLGIQHSIGNSVLDLKYAGTQNRHQNYYTEINLPAAGLLPGLQADSSTYDNVVPYSGYHGIRMARNEANGDYNSFQTSIRGSVKSDLQYQVGYTYSHTNDAGSQGSSAETSALSPIHMRAGSMTSGRPTMTSATSSSPILSMKFLC